MNEWMNEIQTFIWQKLYDNQLYLTLISLGKKVSLFEVILVRIFPDLD